MANPTRLRANLIPLTGRALGFFLPVFFRQLEMSNELDSKPNNSTTSNDIPPAENWDRDELGNPSIVGEFLLFLKENKKWWLIPIIVMTVVIGALIWFGAGPGAPFIYTLF